MLASNFIYPQELEDVFGRPVTMKHVRELVRRGDFPPPRQLSPHKVAWRRRDIDAWVESRPPAPAWPA
jgi:predicted DNA-binding transcriptional regulator AlpA